MEISIDRLMNNLLTLGKIGYEEHVGTSRPAYSNAFFEGRDYVQQCMKDAGLDTRVDEVGNLTGTLSGEGKIIAVGSHIDTVPGGGMYDGTLGVMAGIEVVRALRESGYQFRHPIEIIAFNEEEGNVVGGTFGSKAFTGQQQEQTAIEKLESYGMDLQSVAAAKRDKEQYRCYLELHIEQGGILAHKGLDIGIVEGIVAIARYLVTVPGEANHAGSTPMELRDDALLKACGLIQKIVEISRQVEPAMTCTIGELSVEPGAVNVVPGKVTFPVELRTLHTASITQAIEQFRQVCAEMGVTIKNFLWQDATIMDRSLQKTVEEACNICGCQYQYMPSGAGHDAINTALFTPTAMLFIPSIGGISHSPREYSSPEDIRIGAQVLMETIIKLDQQEDNTI